MKALILAFSLIFSVSAQAKEVRLICLMGDIADMDIVIQQLDGGKKEVLKVILMGMDGESVEVYQNTNLAKESVFDKYEKSEKIEVLVSESDLKDVFGGAYLNAGMLKMAKSPIVPRYDVKFAAKGVVYTASCAPLK